MEGRSISELRVKVPWGHIAAKTWEPKYEPVNSRILLVHGSLDNAGSFDRLIALLPQNHYYVSIDLPSHGFSSHFPAGVPLKYFDYVLAIRYVLDDLKWEHITYVGHSLGAHLGTLFSLIYPGRVEKLVLLDGCIPMPISNDQIINQIRNEQELSIKAYKQNKAINYTKDAVLKALMNPEKGRLTVEAAKALFERSVTKIDNNLYQYNRDIRARMFVVPILSLDQSLYLLSQLKVDTLLILASDTLSFIKEVIPEIVNVLKNKDNVNIVKVQGNHDVHNNSPEKVSMHITKFLSCLKSKL